MVTVVQGYVVRASKVRANDHGKLYYDGPGRIVMG